jgi:hypothetical protein
MTKGVLYGRGALLPGQGAWQYLTEETPGVDGMTSSLLRQLRERGEAQPICMLASFSLHYLPKPERDAYFIDLAHKVSRPMLLVIIKGVGETQRPSAHAVRSVYFGLHYVVHCAEKHPRVVEAHVCLVLPPEHPAEVLSRERALGAGADGADGAPPPLPPLVIPDEGLESTDKWMLQTFATVEKRCRRQGLNTGVNYFEESWL